MIGMLWRDDDPKSDLASKIYQACDFYLLKYGQMPNLCWINPKMAPKDTTDDWEGYTNGVTVRKSPYIMPNHFLLEVEKVKGE